MLDNFMFYAKETLLECVRESVLKTTYSENQRKYGHVESRPATIPCTSAGTLSSSSQLHGLFGS